MIMLSTRGDDLGGPPRRIDVGKAEVLALQPAQEIGGVPAHRLAVVQVPRHLGEALELGVVLRHAPLRVVACRAGRDEELPVGGLEEQELPGDLREHALQVPARLR
jgi:hypothetical protein